MTFEQTLCPLVGRSCRYDKPKCTDHSRHYPIWENSYCYNKNTRMECKYEDRVLIKDMKVCPFDWGKYDKERKPHLYPIEKERYQKYLESVKDLIK